MFASSIFLEFNLPNSATWFYFSFFLTITILFQFHRFFSIRNVDLLGLFLFVPGFLLIQEANQTVPQNAPSVIPQRTGGYLWLLVASALWFVRCLFDFATIRRPLMRSNLSSPGLVCFAIAIFLCLCAVAIRRPLDAFEPVGKQPVTVSSVSDGATAVVAQVQDTKPNDWAALRKWTERGLSMIGHAVVVLGLVFIGWRHFRDAEIGIAMGGLYLLLPYTAYHIAQLHHVLPAALTTWAVFAYRHPRVSGWLMGIASGSCFFPVLLLPLWLHFYWNRGSLRFLLGYFTALLIALSVTLTLLWAAGLFPNGLTQAMHLADWQPWKRPLAESVWQGVHWAYRLPVFVVFGVFTLTTFVWPTIRTVANVVAASAAVLIGVQFWFADRGGLYVLWYTPLLLMMIFRPSAIELEPPPLEPTRSWTGRMVGRMWRQVRVGSTASPPSLAA